MFDFLGRRKTDRRASTDRRRVGGPITIGFEQLEGREMLSSGLAVVIIPAGLPPLRSMPRPLIGSFNPEAGGEAATAPSPRPAPGHRELRSRRWPLSERFRLG
jgi:hypothetical protein